MQIGDQVYYQYTDKNGTAIKSAAIVLDTRPDGVFIRVGRFDLQRSQFTSFESVVAEQTLSPRSVPCSHEEDLKNPA